MDLQSFREHVDGLSKTSLVLARADHGEVMAIAAAGQRHFDHRRAELFRRARLFDEPIARTYMSDGWGVTTATTVTATCNGKVFRREGRKRSEYLLELQIWKAIDQGGAYGWP